MKRKFIVPCVVAGVGLLTPQIAALADEPTPVAPPTSSMPFQSNLTVVDGKDNETLYSVSGPIAVKGFLENKGIDPSKYKNEDGTAIGVNDQSVPGVNYKVYRVQVDENSGEIEIPIPTKEVKVDDLPKGQTRFKEEGKAGKAIVSEHKKVNAQGVEETVTELSIVEVPKPKIIEVGNADPTPTRTATRGVRNNRAYNGSYRVDFATVDPMRSSSNQIVANAVAQLGKPYVWGATGPNSFDCSGLVYYVWNTSGKKIPRLTAAGYGNMAKSISPSEIQPGDILWSNTHIGIYVGDGKVVHAANSKDGVIVSSLNWFLSAGHTPARLS